MADTQQVSPGIRKVITVCSNADLAFWSQSQPYLLQHIDSPAFEVIVPDASVAQFKTITLPGFQVTPVSTYLSPHTLAELRSTCASQSEAEFDALIKPIIQIQAAQTHPDDDVLLIWDADNLPLKKLSFINTDHTLNFYSTHAQHPPYFDTLHTLTGLDKIAPNSLHTKCQPVRAGWAKAFCAHIETAHQKPWAQAVCEIVNAAPGGSFSAFESLGNFALHHHRESVRLIAAKGFLNGAALFGMDLSKRAHKLEIFSKYYDFVAFQQADTPEFLGINIGCGNQRMEKTFQGNRMLNTDIDDLPAADLVFDCNDPEWFLPDQQFEHVVINNVIEHCTSVLHIMLELNRILKPGGVLQFELPFIGSYNHGTDITHNRGFTFDSFNFLFRKQNYLFRYPERNPFNFKLIQFWRENTIDTTLVLESFEQIPHRTETHDWVRKMLAHEIPGTFGYIFQKMA